MSSIVSLEPDPVACRLLAWSLALNNVTHRVWPVCAGLSEGEDAQEGAPWSVFPCDWPRPT